ncbi:MAG: efflux RND transporter periplasmic adaptor subunit [Gammaproteobacteria bacterium]|nr:efflux RND transporter periplasmic adaptor subunit [Gammaproteobacteria bacterium]MDH5304687.1 efflux RND transporter periplasmic adaptor subunit [Gammaproteobacteria bacterium]MDH5323118.1 efflux RND transporter periplasmic adaptor subunit [Gammaproteobacteria bacterium]
MNKMTTLSTTHRLALLTTGLCAILAACGPADAPERPEVARPVKMITIGDTAGSATLEVPGSVFAAQSAELAFEVSGRMLARMVEEGQLVQAGDVVARLDDRDYVQQRDRERAQRDTAQADYERYAKAYQTNAVTEQQVSRAKGQFDVSQANLNVAQKALDETRIRAPFSGRIVKRLVDDFANVGAKQPVLVLQDESSLELRVNVAERDWARGDATLALDEINRRLQPRVQIASLGGRQFPARIKELSASADPVTRTYSVTFAFETPTDVRVSPGMTGSVIVDLYTQNIQGGTGVAIPGDAIVADETGKPFVWVVDESSMRVSKRSAEVGELSGKDAHILGGLSGGERIIVSGVNSLSDNMLVRSIDQN